ncbi:hypothetical protein AB0F81_40325, partial [Actinoplanes sp. NPDC024001]|uniref:hypothetical protein n=1 Tax=Actinoplanes sp. NPDC024001 TaxID=3154598 RepID=UPI0033DE788A
MPWSHHSPIGHPFDADFDCSGLDVAAKFAIHGDFDGDGRDEIAVAPDTPSNAFWVMDFDPAAGAWAHLSPLPDHPLEADFVSVGLQPAVKLAVAGDVDGD